LKALKNNKTKCHGISRRTFPALNPLMPSQTLYLIRSQIHALLLQQTASKPFWWLFYFDQLNSFSLRKTINL